MDVNEWMSYECSDAGTYTVFITFITHLLVHMHQKMKIALDIAAKIYGPVKQLNCDWVF
jgi:hypothetical protein